MIERELYGTRAGGTNLYRTFSNAGLMIQKVGTDEVYDEAVDVERVPYTYEEVSDVRREDDNGNSEITR